MTPYILSLALRLLLAKEELELLWRRLLKDSHESGVFQAKIQAFLAKIILRGFAPCGLAWQEQFQLNRCPCCCSLFLLTGESSFFPVVMSRVMAIRTTPLNRYFLPIEEIRSKPPDHRPSRGSQRRRRDGPVLFLIFFFGH